ncbi:hypothetical protein K435DRAFT_821395 [Dendrothele bispora CBS 962.96]|uniref:Uncharacterized protein n=1 Tax=Dendrothele bispora (strain CBS 962.96) TaxID=1314807 RepID=A0A4V4HE15_DENBC|nr:hypothetical protein K435DRAFT_821395 [Dendrothele bispora CBS 962.96]
MCILGNNPTRNYRAISNTANLNVSGGSGGKRHTNVKCLRHSANADDVYGAADTLISKARLMLHVANFSKRPIVVNVGGVLGKCHNPDSWLDKSHQLSSSQRDQAFKHVQLVRTLLETERAGSCQSNVITSEASITLKAHRNATGTNDPSATDPIEGGPKTSEVHIEDVPTERLLTDVSISTDLTASQRARLEKILLDNSAAFGLDGRLGTFDAKVDIPLKPGSQPVSLPPFPYVAS